MVHLELHREAPEVPVVDLAHQIPPYDVRSGAMTLWRCAPWLHQTVVLAVVDPGVGTARSPVAIEVADTATVLVGPDNGLLLPAALSLGQVTGAVRLRPAPRVRGRGATFDGRDLFAPAAARIAAGRLSVRDAGDPIDAATLAGAAIPRPVREDDGTVRCEVLWIDRFGNAQLNAVLEDVSPFGGAVLLTTKAGTTRVRVVGAFGDLGDAEPGLLADSYGQLALVFNSSAAAGILALAEGDSLTIRPVA